MADAGGDKGVEAVERVRIEREARAVAFGEKRPFVVVEAHGVEAEAREIRGQTVGVGDRRRVGAMDEIDAAEADFLARSAFELEVIADGDDAAELPGRLVVRDRGREIERGAGLDPVFARGGRHDGNPVRPGLHHHLPGLVERRCVAGEAENGVDGIRDSGLDGILREENAQRDDRRTPRPVVLHEDALRFRKLDFHPRVAVRAEDREARNGAAEEMRLFRDGLRDGNRAAVGEETARDAADGEARFEHDLRHVAVAVRDDRPAAFDGAVAGGPERCAAVEAQGARGDVFAALSGHVDREGAGAVRIALDARTARSAAEFPRRRVRAHPEQEIDRGRKRKRRAPDGRRGNGFARRRTGVRRPPRVRSQGGGGLQTAVALRVRSQGGGGLQTAVALRVRLAPDDFVEERRGLRIVVGAGVEREEPGRGIKLRRNGAEALSGGGKPVDPEGGRRFRRPLRRNGRSQAQRHLRRAAAHDVRQMPPVEEDREGLVGVLDVAVLDVGEVGDEDVAGLRDGRAVEGGRPDGGRGVDQFERKASGLVRSRFGESADGARSVDEEGPGVAVDGNRPVPGTGGPERVEIGLDGLGRARERRKRARGAAAVRLLRLGRRAVGRHIDRQAGVPRGPEPAGRLAFGRAVRGIAQVGFREDHRIGGLERGDVAAEEKAERGAFGGEAERVAAHVEISHRPCLGLFDAGFAVAPREAPHAAPVLERAEDARRNAADAAVAAGTGVVPLRDGEGLSGEAAERDGARPGGAPLHRVRVGAARRQLPRLVEEGGVVDVEVVVHEIERFARELVLDGIVPAGKRRERGLATQFVAQERRQALREPRFGIGEELRERRSVAPPGRGAVVGVELVRNRARD